MLPCYLKKHGSPELGMYAAWRNRGEINPVRFNLYGFLSILGRLGREEWLTAMRLIGRKILVARGRLELPTYGL
jgi:hypothetical protein